MEKKPNLKEVQKETQEVLDKVNTKIDELGLHTSRIYEDLKDIQEQFDKIRNVTHEKLLEYQKIKKERLNWKHQAQKIQSDYNRKVVENTGKHVAGAGLGAAVAAVGPTAAMGIATTFGVASTGTAISALSGVAATNAALAWLGGGALAAGGGGMALGNTILALAGPIGWGIAGFALIGGSIAFILGRKDQKVLEAVYVSIGERDICSYQLAIVEMNERMKRIDEESRRLEIGIGKISTFGLDYNEMSEKQQYELGAYINLMNASTQLLVNPIMALQPKINEDIIDCFFIAKDLQGLNRPNEKTRSLLIYLGNLLYGIELELKERKLFWNSIKGNKKLMDSLGLKEKEVDHSIQDMALEIIEYVRES